MKKKKIALILAGCLLIAGASFGASYSYMQASDEAVNEFTIGRNEIEVTEEYEPPKELKPGVAFTKKPTVTNTGNIACWVRMRADFSDSEMEKLCEFTIDSDWIEKSDGYYYYTRKLEPGKSTSSLFAGTENNIKISDGVTEEKFVNFDILIYAESCGAEKGDTYEKAWGLS